MLMWVFLGNSVLQCHQHIWNSWKETWAHKTQPAGFSEEKNEALEGKLIEVTSIHDGADQNPGVLTPNSDLFARNLYSHVT